MGIESSIESIWTALGKENVRIFGKECAVASVWMFSSLVLRFICRILFLESFVPYGVLFALPIFMQLLGQFFPPMEECHPLLPVRLTESIMGRISPRHLSVIIPAHFLGCVFGATCLKALQPIFGQATLRPITYTDEDLSYGLVTNVIIVSLYILCSISLPSLLETNRLSTKWVSLPIIPLMFFSVPDKTSSFNPAAVYALWLVGNADSSGTANEFPLQPLHIAAPVIGAVLAGLICVQFFPDDPACWMRRSKAL